MYYLPLREVLNKSDVENDKIKYDNGVITIDFWTQELTVVYSVESPESGNTAMSKEKSKHTIPSEYSWSSTCEIGSNEFEIAGEKHILANSPYIENGVTYVPYEYLQNLRLYENKYFYAKTPLQKQTSKFTTMLLFGFDSESSEFYTDYIQLNTVSPNSNEFSYSVYNAEAKISKTGYRTGFEAYYDYFELNNPAQNGNMSVKLNEVTRIYSKGSDIEGLFTVVKDGEVIYDNERGRITGLPVPAGEGVLDMGITKVKIGTLQFEVFFNGFDCISEEYSARSDAVTSMTDLSDTVRKSIIPKSVKLNDITVRRGSKLSCYLRYNTDKRLIDANIEFDNYNGTNEKTDSFVIHTEIDSEMSVIDENTISAEMYISNSRIRLDSFDAIITILPDGTFELKSTDGKYIIRGTAEAYVPQWQWSEEQKNAPAPQVIMINE